MPETHEDVVRRLEKTRAEHGWTTEQMLAQLDAKEAGGKRSAPDALRDGSEPSETNRVVGKSGVEEVDEGRQDGGDAGSDILNLGGYDPGA